MAALFFVHEATRVFHDRLLEQTEKGRFYQFLSKEVENYFQVKLLYFKNYFKWCLGQKWCFINVLRLFCISKKNLIPFFTWKCLNSHRFGMMEMLRSWCLCSCIWPLTRLETAPLPPGRADTYTLLIPHLDPPSLSRPWNFSCFGALVQLEKEGASVTELLKGWELKGMVSAGPSLYLLANSSREN